jgi:hypothetical protein
MREWHIGKDVSSSGIAAIASVFKLGAGDVVPTEDTNLILTDHGMQKLMARPAGVGLVTTLAHMPKRELAEAWVAFNPERKFRDASGCNQTQILAAAAFETVMARFIKFECEAGQPIPGTESDDE